MKGRQRYPAIGKAGPFRVYYYDCRSVLVSFPMQNMVEDALLIEIAALLNAECARHSRKKKARPPSGIKSDAAIKMELEKQPEKPLSLLARSIVAADMSLAGFNQEECRRYLLGKKLLKRKKKARRKA